MSPALAGRLLTTEPPGKSLHCSFDLHFSNSDIEHLFREARDPVEVAGPLGTPLGLAQRKMEKTLESPLDCKEIQPAHSEGDQPWDFFGRNKESDTPQ